MTAPAEQQQAPEVRKSLNDQIGDEFDRLSAEEEADNKHVDEAMDALSDESTETDTDTKPEREDEPTEEIEASEDKEEAHATDEAEYDTPAPERWPAEMREKYASLPPDARKILMEGVYKPMQKTYTQSTQQMAEQRKSLDPMYESLQRYREQFDKAGVSPQQAFDQSLSWQAHILQVGPEQGLADMAKAYGIKEFGQQSKAGEDADQWLTPFEKSMKAQLDEVKGQLTQTATQTQQREQAQQQEAQERYHSEVRSNIQTFANATKDGKALHPHFETVAPRMTGLMQGGLVSKVDGSGNQIPMNQQLATAYEMACRLDPSIQAKSVTQTRAQQVARAAAANRSVVDKNPAGSVRVKQPITDFISDEYDRLNR